MQFKKLLLLLIIGFSSFATYAQDQAGFPFSGKYRVYNEAGSTPDNFNYISVDHSLFSLMQDNTSLETYQLIYSEENRYDVVQYIPNSNYQEIGDKRRFTIQVDSSTATDIFVTIIHSEHTEKFHLVQPGM